jgi:hypothetical protein
MVLRICEKCKKEFTKKSNYMTHVNKKIPCDKYLSKKIDENNKIADKIVQNNLIIKKFKLKSKENNKHNLIDDKVDDLSCKYCLKIFCRKSVLKTHINCHCKVKKQDDINKDIIFNELIEKKKLEDENKLITKKYNELIEKNKLLEENKLITEKYNKLLKKTNKSKASKKPTQIIQNTQNIQNNNVTQNNINIQIIQFGKEDLKQIDGKHYLKIIQDNKISGSKFITEIIKSIHFNPSYPQFQNIYISDINRDKCMIHNGKNWQLSYLDKNNNIITEIIDKTVNYSYENNDIFREEYKNNNFLKKRMDIMNKYIEKCDNDYIQDMEDEDEENPSGKNKKIIKDCKIFKEMVEDNVKLLLYNEKDMIVQQT